MLISLRNLEKSYPQGPSKYYVLRQITLDVAEGEFVTFMGPSGAGKSTLLHILGMLDNDYEGEYHFLDQPVHKLKPRDRSELHKANIGFVFQSYHLLDNLTVYENIDLPLSYRDVKRTDRQGMVADILDRFNIVGKKDLYPNQLSGGQQQLVAIARAVVAKPSIILPCRGGGRNLFADERPQSPGAGVELVDRHAVEPAGAVAPGRDPVVVGQRLEVPADAGLRHLQHCAELGDGQLVLFEQEEHPAPCGVRQRRHVLENRDH